MTVSIREVGIKVKQGYSGCGAFRWQDIVFHRQLKCSTQVINGAAKKFILGEDGQVEATMSEPSNGVINTDRDS